MPLLNYTTGISAQQTVGEIHVLLVKGGARRVMSEYGPAGEVTGLLFSIETPVGNQSFSLPVHVPAVLQVLERQRVRDRYLTPEHAERVAWRILKDWVEAQLAIVETEMVSLDQVMLPYMRSVDGRTVYELYLQDRLALPSQAEGG